MGEERGCCLLSSAGPGAGNCRKLDCVECQETEQTCFAPILRQSPTAPGSHKSCCGCPNAQLSCRVLPAAKWVSALPLPVLTPHPLQLAPENTLMSLQKAVDCEVQVFETDVMVR